MAANIYDLSTTAASNTTIDGTDVSGTTGLVKNGDNVMRSLGAYMAQFADDLGGVTTVGGTANAMTVTAASGYASYANGQMFSAVVTTANTATMTINVNSIGAKTVKKYDSSGVIVALSANDNAPGLRRYTYLSGPDAIVLLNPAQEARYAPSHISGLALSNNGSDATNDIDIAVGSARAGDDTANMDLASALTKKLDAAWAVGTNQGMLDGTESVAGTPDTSTWYHIWLIKRPDTGVVDVLASESATAPTMPTNYTLKRRIGAVYRTSGAAIRAFTQSGDEFLWMVPLNDVTDDDPGTSAVLRTLSVPTGVKVESLAAYTLADNSAAGQTGLLITSPDQTDTAPTSSLYDLVTVATGGTITNSTFKPVRTDTSARVRTRLDATGGDIFVIVNTYGWNDPRGRAL